MDAINTLTSEDSRFGGIATSRSALSPLRNRPYLGDVMDHVMIWAFVALGVAFAVTAAVLFRGSEHLGITYDDTVENGSYALVGLSALGLVVLLGLVNAFITAWVRRSR